MQPVRLRHIPCSECVRWTKLLPLALAIWPFVKLRWRCVMGVRLVDFPQLKLIAWNRIDDDTLDEKEVLALYERNWRYVDTANLIPQEKDLIDRLVREYGNGVLHV